MKNFLKSQDSFPHVHQVILKKGGNVSNPTVCGGLVSMILTMGLICMFYLNSDFGLKGAKVAKNTHRIPFSEMNKTNVMLNNTLGNGVNL